MSSSPSAGTRVRLCNLQSTPELNDAVGIVVEPIGERVPVKLLGPAAKIKPDGVLLKPANLTILPPQKAVSIASYTVDEVDLNGAQSQSSASWHACPTPKMLGLPLALKQLNKAQRFSNESMAVYLLSDPRSGFAPPWAQSGLGPVLVARTDGEDFTKEQMFQLHDYNCHLMDLWGEGEPPIGAYSPLAYQAFQGQREEEARLNAELGLEESEDEDDG